MKTLRSWIIMIIVMAFVYEAYAIGAVTIAGLMTLTDATRSIFHDLSVMLYCFLMGGFAMAGWRLMHSDEKNRLAVWGGGALLASGAFKLFWQIPVLVAYHVPSVTLGPGLITVFTVLPAVLLYAALVLIARYYGRRDLLGLAIGYTVADVVFKARFVWTLFVPLENNSAQACFGLVATVGIVLELVYLFKWAKLLKTDNRQELAE